MTDDENTRAGVTGYSGRSTTSTTGYAAKRWSDAETERLWDQAPAHLRVLVDREIGRLRAIIRVNGLRAGASHTEIDEVLNG